MRSSATLRVQRFSGSSQRFFASCWLSVVAPCSLRPSFRSTYTALTMRSGSRPWCWKKRLSSAEVPQVDTTTGTLSQVIDGHRVVDLPLNGRNAATLITLVAGVVDATNQGNGVNQGNGKTFPAAVVISANGTLPNQSN